MMPLTPKTISPLIERVLDRDLCCGCGACVGACPAGALTIDLRSSHEPSLDESRCIGCGLCLEVCPGRGYPIVRWTEQRGEEDAFIDAERGPVRRYVKGYSTDPGIRLNASSGGIATSLLLHLLKTRQVDEAAVIGMANELPIAHLTSDPQVVRDAAMSKYGPVPMLAMLIPELKARPRRIAMTVTPCQLAGWTLAARRIPRLQESTVLAIGLFCGWIQSYDSLTSIAATLGIRYPGEASFIAWRYGPYPGSARFECPDGSSREKPLYPMLDVALPLFSLRRCFFCPEGANWLADIVLGDNHHGGTAKTIMVCRTRRGQEALESARDAAVIVLEEVAPDEADRSVIQQITHSKLLPAIVLNHWLRTHGNTPPEFDYDMAALVGKNLRRRARLWVLRYRLTFWARSGWRMTFLLKRPALLEKTGHFLYHFPLSIPGFSLAVKLKGFFMRVFKNH